MINTFAAGTASTPRGALTVGLSDKRDTAGHVEPGRVGDSSPRERAEPSASGPFAASPEARGRRLVASGALGLAQPGPALGG